MTTQFFAGGWTDAGWRRLMQVHPSVIKLYLFYVVPLSLIPPAMLYYAGMTHGGKWLPAVSRSELLTMAIVFFIAELIIVPVMAGVIQRLGEVIDVKPRYQDAFMLAAFAPTPLWIAPLFLFVPNALVNIVVSAFAMLFAAMLIFRGVDPVFKLHEPGHALLMAGSILAAGLVAWIVLVILALVAWGYVVA